jgi:hypothetical protein
LQVSTIGPEQVEGHIGKRLRAPQEIIELRPSGLVDGDHLAVDYRLVDLEQGRQLFASKRLKTLPLREIRRQRPCSM